MCLINLLYLILLIFILVCATTLEILRCSVISAPSVNMWGGGRNLSPATTQQVIASSRGYDDYSEYFSNILIPEITKGQDLRLLNPSCALFLNFSKVLWKQGCVTIDGNSKRRCAITLQFTNTKGG